MQWKDPLEVPRDMKKQPVLQYSPCKLWNPKMGPANKLQIYDRFMLRAVAQDRNPNPGTIQRIQPVLCLKGVPFHSRIFGWGAPNSVFSSLPPN